MVWLNALFSDSLARLFGGEFLVLTLVVIVGFTLRFFFEFFEGFSDFFFGFAFHDCFSLLDESLIGHGGERG